MVAQLKFIGDNVSSILDKMEVICSLATNLEDVTDKICINLNVARTSLIDVKILIDATVKRETALDAPEADVKEEETKFSMEPITDANDGSNLYDDADVSMDFTEDEIKSEPSDDKKKVKKEISVPVPSRVIPTLESAQEFVKFMKLVQKSDENFSLPTVTAAIENSNYACFIAVKPFGDDKGQMCKCRICKYETPDREALSHHVADSHFVKVQCSDCDQMLYEFELDKHEGDHDEAAKHEKRVSCPTCGKIVASKKKLKYHMEVHTLDRSIPCDQCEKKYRTQRDLVHHKQKAHTGKMFPCESCEKVFSQKCYLQRHVKIVHENLVTMECTECGKVFPNEMKLNRHMAVHTIPATIPCDICNRMYREQKDLNIHKKQIHFVSYEACKICGKEFKNKTHLNDHMKSHSGIRDKTCDLCGKGFSQNKILKRHVEQFHAENNQFSCHLCEKNFKYKNSLYQHIKAHEGLEVCTCEECGKSFSMKSNLKKHMRRVHKIFQKKRIKLPMTIGIKEYRELPDNSKLINQETGTINTELLPNSEGSTLGLLPLNPETGELEPNHLEPRDLSQNHLPGTGGGPRQHHLPGPGGGPRQHHLPGPGGGPGGGPRHNLQQSLLR